MGRPLQKAPEVFADESFPDANIVAEYLDCQLESTEVSDEYEDVCYDSPEMLAEAADCYDLLNNCLCKPMNAPKNCRRRLYYVAWEEAAPLQSKNTENSEPYPDCKVVDIERSANSQESQRQDTEASGALFTKFPTSKQRVVHTKTKGDVEKKRSRGRLRVGVKAALLFLVVAGGINSFVRWHNRESVENIGSQESAMSAPDVEESLIDSAQLAEESYTPTFEEQGSREESFSDARELEPIKVASLPVNEEKNYEELNDNLRNDMTNPENEESVPTDEERGEIFIPETNNDVFSGTTMF
ncbi:MAG: hypothetical protein ACI4NP_04660 [Thermoguttaceae bacterium]